jgi:hypothetical protein
MRQAQLEACLCSPALSVMGFTGEDTGVFDVQFACKPCICLGDGHREARASAPAAALVHCRQQGLLHLPEKVLV